MDIRLALPTAAAISILAGCASEPAVDIAAEREALRAAAQAYEQAAMAGDLDGFGAAYAAGAVMMPPNEGPVSGEEAIRAYYGTFTSLDGFAFESELQTVEVSPDAQMGYTVGRVGISWMEGDTQMNGTFRDVHIWTRDAEGAWKIAVDIWNSLAPAAGMP